VGEQVWGGMKKEEEFERTEMERKTLIDITLRV
jgi:hypothetical protein